MLKCAKTNEGGHDKTIEETRTNLIAWTVKEKMEYFNISLLLLEQLKSVSELTLVLSGLVKFLVSDFNIT